MDIDQTKNSEVKATQFAPVGIFGGVRNEQNHYLSIETYGESVIIKIHQDEKVAAFQISPESMLNTIGDIKAELDKCCKRVRSDNAIPV